MNNIYKFIFLFQHLEKYILTFSYCILTVVADQGLDHEVADQEVEVEDPDQEVAVQDLEVVDREVEVIDQGLERADLVVEVKDQGVEVIDQGQRVVIGPEADQEIEGVEDPGREDVANSILSIIY